MKLSLLIFPLLFSFFSPQFNSYAESKISVSNDDDSADEAADKAYRNIYGQDTNKDPLEKFNRKIFWFNSKVDSFIAKPIARGYNKVTNPSVRRSVTNFFRNLTSPITLANNILQGRGEDGTVTFWRFLINSTIGLGGFIDVAGAWGLPYKDSDFSNTLAFYNVPRGPYLVIPFTGPSTARNVVNVASLAIKPYFYVEGNNIFKTITEKNQYIAESNAIKITNIRANLLPITDDLEANSLDLYVAMRNAYLSNNEFDNKQKQSRQSLFENYNDINPPFSRDVTLDDEFFTKD